MEMKKGLMMGMLAGVMVLGAGCALQPAIETPTTTNPVVSDNDIEKSSTEALETDPTTAPEIVEIEQMVESTSNDEQAVHETVEIPELEEPLDEEGEWTSYMLGTDIREERMEPSELVGTYGTEFYVNDYPLILIPDDEEKQDEFNTQLFIYVLNDYHNRFQMKDLDINLTCTVLNQTRFVSYQLEGEVKHVGDDARYEDEREYRYYINIDRMTMQRLNLETVIGWDTVEEAISTGDYEVVRAEDSVFETFSNELLADIYLNEPMFADDTEHELDFYIEDGAVHVVIWVGEENGFYAILKLNPEPLIQ